MIASVDLVLLACLMAASTRRFITRYAAARPERGRNRTLYSATRPPRAAGESRRGHWPRRPEANGTKRHRYRGPAALLERKQPMQHPQSAPLSAYAPLARHRGGLA